jgi:lantibiotic biosynthesis protein
MQWSPLLADAERDAALGVATSLAKSVTAPRGGGPRDACLAGGLAGLAVCHAVIASQGADGEAAERAGQCLQAAIDALATAPLGLSLYSGFPGIAWAAQFVDQLLPAAAEDGGTGDRNDDIDETLAEVISRYPADAPYDLIDGLVGLGSYALARWPRPAAARCLEGVLDQLMARARQDESGVHWWTAPEQLPGPRRQLFPAGGIDVGMAHGMAGIVPLLSRACTVGAAGRAEHDLLDGAVAWILAHLVQTPSGATCPPFVPADGQPVPSRTAWCYGDPGVAVALLLAARDAGVPHWAQAGTDLALQAARRPPELTGVADAGLCHGTAGLAHVFARLHQLTGHPELAEAARRWLGRTLDACRDYLAMCGSSPLASTAQLTWNGPGLLEGAAGVALAVLSACRTADPGWDQALLVSTGLPGRAEPGPDRPEGRPGGNRRADSDRAEPITVSAG